MRSAAAPKHAMNTLYSHKNESTPVPVTAATFFSLQEESMSSPDVSMNPKASPMPKNITSRKSSSTTPQKPRTTTNSTRQRGSDAGCVTASLLSNASAWNSIAFELGKKNATTTNFTTMSKNATPTKPLPKNATPTKITSVKTTPTNTMLMSVTRTTTSSADTSAVVRSTSWYQDADWYRDPEGHDQWTCDSTALTPELPEAFDDQASDSSSFSCNYSDISDVEFVVSSQPINELMGQTGPRKNYNKIDAHTKAMLLVYLSYEWPVDDCAILLLVHKNTLQKSVKRLEDAGKLLPVVSTPPPMPLDSS